MKQRHVWVGTLGVCLAMGCATAPLEDDKVALPESHSSEVSLDADAAVMWWQDFGDEALNRLVTAALDENLSLQAAWRRVEQATQARRAVGAARLPVASLNASGGRVRQQMGATQPVTSMDQWNLSVGAGYEVDVWRRIAAGVNQAEFLRDAAAADYDAMAITLSALVCEGWFDLNEQLRLRELLDAQLASSESNAASIMRRYRRGLGSLLDVYQQRQLVANLRSQLPGVEAAVALARHRLAVLIGRMPGEDPIEGVGALPAPPKAMAVEVSVALVEKRPDVSAAFARLAAAEQAAVAAARDRLPGVRVEAGAGYSDDDVDTLFDEWTGQVMVGLALPLTDGGRRRAEAARLKAAARERVAVYAETVREAMREVLDARILETRQAETLTQLDAELMAARKTLKQSRVRYENGLVDYLSVLTALSRVQQLERLMVSARRRQLSYRVQFYRAIAGDRGAARGESKP